MKKSMKLRTGLLCFSLVMILAVFGVALRDKKKQIVLKSDKPVSWTSDADIKLNEVLYNTVNKDNFKDWDLKADTAKYFKDENKVVLENLTVSLYRPDGKTYYLTGKHGELDMDSRNIKIKGMVQAIFPDKTIIRTESVFYDHKKREITTNDKLLIKRGKFEMEGIGAIIDLEREKLTVLSQVKVRGNN